MTVYPGVCQFAEKIKEAIMSAQDAIIASHVQHTRPGKLKAASRFLQGRRSGLPIYEEYL